MTNLEKIILSSFLTVFSGVVVFVLGQIINKFIIEPIHFLKRVLGDIRYALEFHAQAIHTPGGKVEKEDIASEELRKLSCELKTGISNIPFYRIVCFLLFGFLPAKIKAFEASRHLMGLSNSVHTPDGLRNSNRVEKISQLLDFD